MNRTTRVALPLALALGASLQAAEVDFKTHIKPILESTCVHCHGESKQEGDYRLDTKDEAFKAIDGKPMLVAGKSAESKLYTTTILPADDEDVMPPKKDGHPLDKSQTDLLKAWIDGGAAWPDGEVLKQQPRIDFVKHIQPIIETRCVGCHNPDKMEEYGDYDCSTRNAAMGSEDDGLIVPFKPNESSFYKLLTLAPDKKRLMPPKKSNGPLPPELIEQVRLWIEQGAVWPDGMAPLTQKELTQDRPPNPDDMELVKKIHALIMEKSAERAEADMKGYDSTVPKTGAAYSMVPIKGGEFMLGSPESEPGRKADEGPQVKVKVDPFWMGKFEVTWDEYLPFQVTPIDRWKDGAKKTPNPADQPADVVSSPTAPYVEMSFGMGQEGYPAIAMTEHSALKYCQWLSAQTGHFYRLPTEAEWEYACRAGTTTAYSFGDDPNQLDQYAWYFDNSMEGFSDNQYQKVGKKKPNPWGLHDMHGNVMEWVLDQHSADYSAFGKEADNPWNRPKTLWGHVARGGSWNDDAADLRSAARRPSIDSWKSTDPQLPKSIWYLTDVKWLGFRLVRPLKVPSPEEMYYIWNCGRPEELAKKMAAGGK